ncbi:MAG: hypothetical protein ABIO67_07855 [Mycobacteriales bacterium]
MTPAQGSLDIARQDAGLTQHQLWFRYFALGGMTPALELEAVCHGAMVATDLDHDRIAHAINERFTELGRNHPVPYSEDSEDNHET